MHLKALNKETIQDLGLVFQEKKEFEDGRGELSIKLDDFEVDATSISFKTSFSKPFVGRGLHWQNEVKPQKKIISVVSGKIIDFVLDTKDFSTLYYIPLQPGDDWLLIPEHLAHGFISLEPTVFQYLCIGEYSAENEVVINVLESAGDLLLNRLVELSPKDRAIEPITVLL